MQDYQELYYNAVKRYNNACSEINECQNKIGSLKVQRQNLTNDIVKYKADLADHETAYEEIGGLLLKQADLDAQLVDIGTKLSSAAANYSVMVSASDVVNRDLSEAYSDGTLRTKNDLSKIMETLGNRKMRLNRAIGEVQTRIRTAENDRDSADRQIKSKQDQLAEWKRRKNSAAYDMEIYRRKMEQDAGYGF